MRTFLWTRIAAVIFGIVPGLLSGACAAEQLDITRCYSGTFTIIDNSEGIMPVLSWEDSGIIMSNSSNKILNGAVFHEAGIQRGIGPERIGHGLLKIMDNDGDTIIVGGPYTGFSGAWDFLEGTGKWKGVKGSLDSERIVFNKPNRPAMPGTYQTCRHETVTFQLGK
jgi:hypothetical protein